MTTRSGIWIKTSIRNGIESMKKFFIFLLANYLLITCAMAQQNQAITLAQNGKTPYTIALANDAIPAEKTAAEQLQKYFRQITGATIAIKAESDVATGDPQILVGTGARVKGLLPNQNWNSLGSDGILIKTVGENLILAGGRPRGTLYAVFQFLEDSAGCRWWTPTENTIPYKSTFDVPQQNVVYIPPFTYREHFTNDVRTDPVFATIMRENGHFQTQSANWGGHYKILGWSHTFSQLLPPEKYFKDHPEWYSDPGNGNKLCTAASQMPSAHLTQLCVSNPAVVDELTQQALAWIEKNPEAGYISISQNDNQNFCQDPACVAQAEKEDSNAGPILNFVNQVAAGIHQKYPGFMVETLAYWGTEEPPKNIRPGQNVIIRLAPSSSDFGHPLDSDWNAETRDNLKGWAQIAPQLFVWNYVTNFRNTILPHPNWAGLGPDLRFFAANNVKGVFQQGDSYTNGVGDFVQLRAWLMGKLMWNPNLDQNKLTDEFLQGYYGPAAPYLKQYLDLIQESFQSQKRTLSTFNTDFSYLTLDTMNQAIELFRQAKGAVKDDKVLSDRVHRESISLTAATLYLYNNLKQTAAREGKKFWGPEDPSLAMTQFVADAKKFGIRNWREDGSFDSEVIKLESMFVSPASLPDFAKNYPPGDVVDLRSPNFRLYNSGSITFFEKDPVASGGITASIIGNTDVWGIQAKIGNFLEPSSDKWHVYAMARVDVKEDAAQTGLGLNTGIYDAPNRKPITLVRAPLKDVAGSSYQKIDLGVHQLGSEMYIWFSPAQNPAVTKVYVDRIILIREK